MTALPIDISNLVDELRALKSSSLEPPLCKIEKFDDECLMSCNQTALIHIAQQLLSLHGKANGAHFTIDAADMAISAEMSLTISLKSDIGLS
jgi:hypothetical protein